MPQPKPDDTQALSAAEIKAEGLKPRVRNTNTQQSVAVQIAAIIMVGLVALALIACVAFLVVSLVGR